ncbi:MAG: thioredoxin [Gammaproteobacteria bacterium]|nr:thioredoxin [Gammaproteobacteria bacterium]MCP5135247.1 thioredoxin [Gammaproteobacteria bacterium]
MSHSPYIVNVTIQNFEQEVIRRSFEAPVLVDFWAEWCGPCKMVLPILEQLAESYAGAVRIAKVNTEVEQQLASQFGIRSIPTLHVYHQGRKVEEMMGAQSEAAFRAVLDKYVTRASDAQREQALEMAENGQIDAAIELLRHVVAEDPGNHAAAFDLVRVHLGSGDAVIAQAQLEAYPIELRNSDEGQALAREIRFAAVAQDAPDPATLHAALTTNPNDHHARLQLAVLNVAAGQHEQALMQLLEVLKRDPGYEDGAAQKNMVAIFDMLGGGELVSRYRRAMFNALH